MTMQAAFTGNDKSKFRIGEDEFNIRVMADAFDRTNIQDVKNLTFMNDKGELIKLSQFADVQLSTGPSKLERKNRIPSIMVKCEVKGRATGTVGAEITAALAEAQKSGALPAGISIGFEGDQRNQNESFGGMALAMIASILFVYLIMVALYDSWIYPFVVLFSIPVALVGALLALALTMKNLSIFSFLGIIMLIGLVAKNAILLVDFTNQAKEEGHNTYDALLMAGKERLRPILMTTVAMVIGMLPIAMASGAGAEWKTGLAWALIGGLTSSMLLTLVLVPVIYMITDTVLAFVDRVFKKKPKDAGNLAKV
jgi:hydrophobic/amphiphilic exporter-1 (mainly G- bacteria), HAE1 family